MSHFYCDKCKKPIYDSPTGYITGCVHYPLEKKLTAVDIVQNFLLQRGYDGLFNEQGDCACITDDLAPCGSIDINCKAGYKMPCDCGEHDWHVGIPKKGEIR